MLLYAEDQSNGTLLNVHVELVFESAQDRFLKFLASLRNCYVFHKTLGKSLRRQFNLNLLHTRRVILVVKFFHGAFHVYTLILRKLTKTLR